MSNLGRNPVPPMSTKPSNSTPNNSLGSYCLSFFFFCSCREGTYGAEGQRSSGGRGCQMASSHLPVDCSVYGRRWKSVCKTEESQVNREPNGPSEVFWVCWLSEADHPSSSSSWSSLLCHLILKPPPPPSSFNSCFSHASLTFNFCQSWPSFFKEHFASWGHNTVFFYCYTALLYSFTFCQLHNLICATVVITNAESENGTNNYDSLVINSCTCWVTKLTEMHFY